MEAKRISVGNWGGGRTDGPDGSAALMWNWVSYNTLGLRVYSTYYSSVLAYYFGWKEETVQ